MKYTIFTPLSASKTTPRVSQDPYVQGPGAARAVREGGRGRGGERGRGFEVKKGGVLPSTCGLAPGTSFLRPRYIYRPAEG